MMDIWFWPIALFVYVIFTLIALSTPLNGFLMTRFDGTGWFLRVTEAILWPLSLIAALVMLAIATLYVLLCGTVFTFFLIKELRVLGKALEPIIK